MGMIYRRKKRDPTTGSLSEVGPYWMKYYIEGRPTQEGTKTFDRAEAQRILKEREGDVARGLYSGPRVHRTRFEDLGALVKQDYEMNKRKTARRLGEYMLHLKPFFATRPNYTPGELVDYLAQDGYTLPALAARFNTSVEEILRANPIIPRDATTMPVGLPMKIPIYYLPLWGTAFQSIPHYVFVNGPAHIGFNTSAFVESTTGWLKEYRTYAGRKRRTGAEMVDYVAVNYSVSPRLLLAILVYQSGALSQQERPADKYLLGFRRTFYDSPYLQLVIAANTLNNAYYGWRSESLTEFDLIDHSLTRPDPWQNAGSVAVQYYF